MPTFQTYSAWIEVDGEALPEYCTKRTDMGGGVAQIAAWVPSVAGQSFRIGYGASIEGSAATDIRFFIDGSKARSEILHERWGRDIGYKEGLESDRGILPFVFGTCRLTDDDNLLEFAGSGNVGEIRLQVSDCMLITKHRQPERLDSLDSQLSREARVIHEATKNGVVHSVQLGKEVPLQKKRSSMEYHVIQREERVHFVFYYRPLEILQAAGIAPRSLPAVAPIPSPRQTVSESTSNLKADAKLPSPRLTPRSPPVSTSKLPHTPTPNASRNPPLANSQSSTTPIALKSSSFRPSQPKPSPNALPPPQPSTSHARPDPPLDPRLRPSSSTTHTHPDPQNHIQVNPPTNLNVKAEPTTDPRLKPSNNPPAKPPSINSLKPTDSSSTPTTPLTTRPPVSAPPPIANNLPEIIDLTLDSDDECEVEDSEIVEIKKEDFGESKRIKEDKDDVEGCDEELALVSRLKAEIAAVEARLAARGLKRKGNDDDLTGGHDRHGKRPATASSSFKTES